MPAPSPNFYLNIKPKRRKCRGTCSRRWGWGCQQAQYACSGSQDKALSLGQRRSSCSVMSGPDGVSLDLRSSESLPNKPPENQGHRPQHLLRPHRASWYLLPPSFSLCASLELVKFSHWLHKYSGWTGSRWQRFRHHGESKSRARR